MGFEKKIRNLSKESQHKKVADEGVVEMVIIIENAKNEGGEERTCQPDSMMDAIAD